MITLAGLALVAACGPSPREPAEISKSAARVLLVINTKSAESIDVGQYYKAKRDIPESHIVRISCVSTDDVPNESFEAEIKAPIRRAIDACQEQIDFIVTTKGVPIRIGDAGGMSVDAHLGAMRLDLKPIDKPDAAAIQRCVSPYFNKREKFSSKTYGFYIVSRLDGYTSADAKALVDNAIAAKPDTGPFLFDQAENRGAGGYADLQVALRRTNDLLRRKGYSSTLDSGPDFVGGSSPLMGYASWGSNDGNFNLEVYRSLKFRPGAIAETFVSTSGRTFRPVKGGQSLAADLIRQGVSGVKGYVSEPYTFALARPEILFDRYTSGFTLAESFAMASLVLKWKDVVIGDPLCAPYAKP